MNLPLPPEDKANLQADLASTLANASDVRTTKALANALREVFGENQAAQRFIDVSRIPLICKSIFDIHANIEEIKTLMKEVPNRFVSKDEFKPISAVVYGLCALLLTGVVVALISLVIK